MKNLLHEQFSFQGRQVRLSSFAVSEFCGIIKGLLKLAPEKQKVVVFICKKKLLIVLGSRIILSFSSCD